MRKAFSILMSVLLVLITAAPAIAANADGEYRYSLTVWFHTDDGQNMDKLEYCLMENELNSTDNAIAYAITDENGICTFNYNTNKPQLYLEGYATHSEGKRWRNYSNNTIDNNVVVPETNGYAEYIFSRTGYEADVYLNGGYFENLPSLIYTHNDPNYSSHGYYYSNEWYSINSFSQGVLMHEPIKNGYDFAGWYYDDVTFENPIVVDDPIINDTAMYAKWECNHTLDADYTNLGANHRVNCNTCGQVLTVDHSFENGVCACGCVNLDNAAIELETDSFNYDATEKKPAVTVIINGNEIDSSLYKTEFTNNVNSGNATVTVKPNSIDAVGSSTASFTIGKAHISPKLEIEDVTYPNEINPIVKGNTGGGAEIITYTYADGSEIVYPAPYDLGVPYRAGEYKAVLTIAESENYNGATVTTYFKINPIQISNDNIEFKYSSEHPHEVFCNGEELNEAEDFTLTVEENETQYIFTVTGINDYYGTAVFTRDKEETTPENEMESEAVTAKKTNEKTNPANEISNEPKTNNNSIKRSPKTGATYAFGTAFVMSAVTALTAAGTVVLTNKKRNSL